MGPPRPIYLPRWLGWSFAIPTLITMNCYPMMMDAPSWARLRLHLGCAFTAIRPGELRFLVFLYRIFPMLANTWAYCWSCYVGCVIYNMYYGWFLIILGCVAYLAIIMDQIHFVVERIALTPNPAAKIFIILMKENVGAFLPPDHLAVTLQVLATNSHCLAEVADGWETMLRWLRCSFFTPSCGFLGSGVRAPDCLQAH